MSLAGCPVPPASPRAHSPGRLPGKAPTSSPRPTTTTGRRRPERNRRARGSHRPHRPSLRGRPERATPPQSGAVQAAASHRYQPRSSRRRPLEADAGAAREPGPSPWGDVAPLEPRLHTVPGRNGEARAWRRGKAYPPSHGRGERTGKGPELTGEETRTAGLTWARRVGPTTVRRLLGGV